ncbi:hypothetical protein F441_20080 [Phytophthora nicotianae CJ01A1]|uniref:Uncharacterized protein n=5 Tax=Phytophthora nicotianae TaxID=4792 RepID=W2PIH6_PHYN3|nr:hypothetical protein PPTG_24271 [Phytophthora nicotianae INRA-310]ETI33086.1 hypothetical protein F443_20200 [Phytophthora nicotianae P1569]ETL26845.1 hypothetical protein L916_19535 [Phytophthora nicotianae]ETO61820.1 hypothetical protein F444_20215 [Phytophthora nicotianae P1976]ETP02895.1 hypothetical protein F441_20080 [Phytophthora nicotianae CJ01A1]ETN00446.1 hypothetical protein PPTG_24271 [Phytophthora nicotianae INRA-310]
MLARRLSTRVSMSVPLQHAKKAKNAAKTATAQQDTSTKPAEDKETNPWSHFTAFNSMEDYVDVTLIQYNNQENDKDEKP